MLAVYYTKTQKGFKKGLVKGIITFLRVKQKISVSMLKSNIKI